MDKRAVGKRKKTTEYSAGSKENRKEMSLMQILQNSSKFSNKSYPNPFSQKI
ncbi:MAG: hypothetical protein Q8O46_00750 [bacterium]|nr:hypothetical protein [bacterium]